MRTIDTDADLQWANPLDIALEEHPPRRLRPPARRVVPSSQPRQPRPAPALALLAAGGALALSVAALVIAVLAFGTVATGTPTSGPPATAEVADDVPAANPPAVPIVVEPEAQPEPSRVTPRRPHDCTVSSHPATRCE